MKKYLLVLIAFTMVFSACKKDKTTTDPALQAAADEATIKAYLAANNITAVKDSASGLYYKIDNPGTGTSATSASNVTIGYVGKFTNGTVFDSSPSATYSLTNLIQAWQIGVPLIKSGGVIELFVPSALGYGATGQGSIPGNTVLIFNISLQSVNS